MPGALDAPDVAANNEGHQPAAAARHSRWHRHSRTAQGMMDRSGIMDGPGMVDNSGIMDGPGMVDSPGIMDDPGMVDSQGMVDGPV
jgi:hypothetical protein